MKYTNETLEIDYLETPRQKNTTVKLDTVLEQRMKAFLLSRRQKYWLHFGR